MLQIRKIVRRGWTWFRILPKPELVPFCFKAVGASRADDGDDGLDLLELRALDFDDAR